MVQWRGRRQSSNVGYSSGGRRSAGIPIPLGRGGMGIGTIVIIGIIALVFGINPLQLFGLGGSGVQQAAPSQEAQADPCGMSETNAFVCTMLADTEDVWNAEFANQGASYTEPVLKFYNGTGMSGCGVAQAAVGPFYCPQDQDIYLDTSFFDQLAQMGGAGDAAEAYVVAHEVGHHVQTLTGISDQVRQMQGRARDQAEANAVQVRMELQADCYAGVFFHDKKQYLQKGDVQEALAAANAIGDDRLQREAQGRIVPDSFTHGTSAQRQQWLDRGMCSGDPADCDTFNSQI